MIIRFLQTKRGHFTWRNQNRVTSTHIQEDHVEIVNRPQQKTLEEPLAVLSRLQVIDSVK